MNLQLEPILSEIEKAVVGKRGVIEKILMALLADDGFFDFGKDGFKL